MNSESARTAVLDRPTASLPDDSILDGLRSREGFPSTLPSLEAPPALSPQRLLSLDAFRGLTIVGMLLVNNVSLDTATPDQLQHAAWNRGLHFADMVFPWFLLIMGVAIPYAAASHRAKGISAWQEALKVLGRAITLVLLGCFLDSNLARRPVFDLDVLQLIGLAYLVAALLTRLRPALRLTLAAGLLVGYWAFLRFTPIPGAGSGHFTEDQNVVSYLNRAFLERYHLSGLLSVIPTAALALIGTVLGERLRRARKASPSEAAWLIGSGLVLAAAGWLWNLDLPFNKPVWTPSYILYAAGWGAAVLGFCYLLMDACGWRAWALPLVVFGSNAIFAYVVPILFKVHILQEWTWRMPDGSSLALQQAVLHFSIARAGPLAGGWLYTVGYMLFWWAILYAMYRKRVFVRI